MASCDKFGFPDDFCCGRKGLFSLSLSCGESVDIVKVFMFSFAVNRISHLDMVLAFPKEI
jgi:hypothetical protein